MILIHRRAVSSQGRGVEGPGVRGQNEVPPIKYPYFDPETTSDAVKLLNSSIHICVHVLVLQTKSL